ncbi:jg25677 [Pararge aegeria aegeria]|uniref:Jg25677 protein n=1 Tax=Pararge aegeria aegeria TaxID=348720 RepID=A0A8S4QZR1_9NEOP|nr:jg25677 [Pararge aegeria aegeria]
MADTIATFGDITEYAASEMLFSETGEVQQAAFPPYPPYATEQASTVRRRHYISWTRPPGSTQIHAEEVRAETAETSEA